MERSMMVDLSDVSILVHWKPDTEERIINQELMGDYYHKYANNVEIIYAYESGAAIQQLPKLNNNDKWVDFHGNSDSYHRTRGFALAAQETKRPVVILHDTDAIIDPIHIRTAANTVEQTEGICICHNGYFLEFDQEVKDKFQDDINIDVFFDNMEKNPLQMNLHQKGKHFQLAHKWALGGSVAVWRKNLNRVNCNMFIGWGYEDDARVELAKKLIGKETVARVNDPKAFFFHLCHPGTVRDNHDYYKNNRELARFIKSMPDHVLRELEKVWEV